MSLDSQTLERLVIDRELGELSGDAAALLESYLAARPEQGEGIRSIDEAIELTRKSLRRISNAAYEALPPPRFTRVSPEKLRFADSLRGGVVGFAAAAAIAIAAWIEFMPMSVIQSPKFTSQMIVSNASHTSSPGSGGFWNLSDLRRGYASRQSRETGKIKWTGPITRPKIGA